MDEKRKTLCIVSPFPPPYGGMSIQAQKLSRLFKVNGYDVIEVRTNTYFPKHLSIIQKIKGVRTFLNTFFLCLNLHKVLKSSDLVYILSGFFNFFFWITAPVVIMSKIHKKPIVLSARGGGAADFFKKYGYLVKLVLENTNIITTPSYFLKDIFKQAFQIETLVIPNIADFNQFNFKKRERLNPKLLVTRNLEVIYDIGCAIKAFKIVSGKYPEATLGIAGSGTKESELKKLVCDLGIKEKVQFYGEVRHRDMKGLYDSYDILVNSSRVDNLPGTILEAFSCGLPVVSTNAGGIGYMVENRKTGLLSDIGDFNGLAQNICEILEDRELTDSLIKNGKKESEKYSWASVEKQMLPLLKKMLKNG